MSGFLIWSRTPISSSQEKLSSSSSSSSLATGSLGDCWLEAYIYRVGALAAPSEIGDCVKPT